MEQIHDRVAGLDVHRDTVAVCVRTPGPRGGVHTEKARFDTTTGGLGGLAGWLAGREVALAAMEATGVYWKPVYYALEDRFELWLCNAHHVKNVPGRKPACPMPGGWRTWLRTGWCGPASCRRCRSGSCGS
jgi:transposase